MDNLSNLSRMPTDSTDDPEIVALFRTIDERGHKKADLARLLEIDASQVTRIRKGQRRLQRHEWRKVEQWLSVSLDQSVRETSDVSILPGLVPLYGWAGAASDERLTFAEQILLGAVPRHPAQTNVHGAFALRINDVSMVPRYEPGELAYVAPNQWPTRGQDCILVTTDNFGYLKRFEHQASGIITLHQLNPDKDLTFKAQDVAGMHAVVGRG